MSDLDAAAWAAIDAALVDNRKFEAIRLYREATGHSLALALPAVEARLAGLSSVTQSSPPDECEPRALATFLGSSFCPRGTLLKSWVNTEGLCCVAHQSEPGTVEINVLPRSGQFGHDLHGYRMPVHQALALLGRGQNLPGADFAGHAGLRSAFIEALMRTLASPAVHRSSRAQVVALRSDDFEAGFAFQVEARVTGEEWRALWARATHDASLRLALEEAAAPAAETDPVPLDGALARLWLDWCLLRCGRQLVLLDHEHFLADLAGVPIECFPGPEHAGFAILLRLAGLAQRSTLPAWLELAVRDRGRSGLLHPAEVRFLAAHWPALTSPLAARGFGSADLHALGALAGQAAQSGDWLLGLSPE